MKEDYVIHKFDKPVKNLLAIRSVERNFFGYDNQFLIIQHEGLVKFVSPLGIHAVTEDQIAAIPKAEIRDAIKLFDANTNLEDLVLLTMYDFVKVSTNDDAYFNNIELVMTALGLLPKEEIKDYIKFLNDEEVAIDSSGVPYRHLFKQKVREMRTRLTVSYYKFHPELIHEFQAKFESLDEKERREKYDSTIHVLGCEFESKDPALRKTEYRIASRFDLYTRGGVVEVFTHEIDLAYIKRAVAKVAEIGTVYSYAYEQLATNCLVTYGYFTTADIFDMNIINNLVLKSRVVRFRDRNIELGHIVFINDKTIFDGCLENSGRYIKLIRQFASIDYSESKFSDHITVSLAAHEDVAVRRNLALNPSVPDVVRQNLLTFDDIREEIDAMNDLKELFVVKASEV